MYKYALILTIATTAQGMHHEIEHRLMEKDQKEISLLKEHISNLCEHIEGLNLELDRKHFDLMLVRDAWNLNRAMRAKRTCTVGTQTEVSSVSNLRRCAGSPDLRLNEDEVD